MGCWLLQRADNRCLLHEFIRVTHRNCQVRAAKVTQNREVHCNDLLSLQIERDLLSLAGIISDATAALAKDRLAQINITVRNPKTKAWEIDVRIRAVVSE